MFATRFAKMVRSLMVNVTRGTGFAEPADGIRNAPMQRPKVRRVEVAGRSPVIGSIPLHGIGPATIELACTTRYSTAEAVLYQLTATENGRRLPCVSRGEYASQKMLLVPILRRSGTEPRVTIWVPDLPWWSITLHYRISIAGAERHDILRAELRLSVDQTTTRTDSPADMEGYPGNGSR